MTQVEDSKTWLFVADNLQHLRSVKPRSRSWWCVDRRCAPKDRCFLYKRLTGIVLLFEITRIIEAQPFCNGFAMATASITIVEVFEPPIPVKALRTSQEIRQEGFFRRNFQGKSFLVHSEKTTKAILSLR
jgi:hypothetical protein